MNVVFRCFLLLLSTLLYSPPASAGADEPKPSRTLEQTIDDGAGVIVNAMSKVLFFPILEEREEIQHATITRDPDQIGALIQQLEARGVDVGQASLTLMLPEDAISPADAEVLTAQLNARFVPTYPVGTRSFSVTRSKGQQGSTLRAKSDGIPIIALWLVVGGFFFTFRMGFINLWAFGHAIEVVRGKFDSPTDPGEVTHFQALASALSATVGLGNIAGVAIAVTMGGPGAIFWMIMGGLFGMSSKFVECTLAQKYREILPDGQILGGPMYYLQRGMAEEHNMPRLGRVLGILFAVLCISASLGGGNTFQVNQSLDLFAEQWVWFGENRWVYGVVMVILVGAVILGGIKRIAATAEKIVPVMCGVYVLACLYILVRHAGEVPAAFGAIFSQAFSPEAGFGGLIGVLVTGVRRAAFSNEAGIGSASIAHSVAKTEYPIREGIVALLEPFIDTVVVCTMTGLVIVITGAYDNPTNLDLIAAHKGAALTARAMGSEITWFPILLTAAAVLFAYSTMLSWSYYGERAATYLFGMRATMPYRILFLTFVFLGSIVTATNILEFGDFMILSMAVPNVLGLFLLSNGVRNDLDAYMKKLNAGEFHVYKN